MPSSAGTLPVVSPTLFETEPCDGATTVSPTIIGLGGSDVLHRKHILKEKARIQPHEELVHKPRSNAAKVCRALSSMICPAWAHVICLISPRAAPVVEYRVQNGHRRALMARSAGAGAGTANTAGSGSLSDRRSASIDLRSSLASSSTRFRTWAGFAAETDRVRILLLLMLTPASISNQF